MEGWKKYKLRDIGTIVGGATPSTKNVSNYDGDISWITPKDLANHSGRYISRGERMISKKGFDSCSCRMLPRNSILFSSRAPIGYVAIANNELCTNQGFKSIIPNDNIIDSLFLYYLLVYYRPVIENMGSGTTFQEVSGSVMKNIEVNIPGIDDQKKIVSILSSLDSKIELNRRINDNLEQQARALFKAWFVDFEPFKDGKFVDSELGSIPEGWRVVSLGEITKQVAEKVGNREGMTVLSPVNSGELVLSEEYFTKQVFSKDLSKYLIVNPLSFVYNPARINIGSIGLNTYDFVGCVSPVYVVFECEPDYHYFFDFYKRTAEFKEEVALRAIGGVRQSLGYNDFSLIKTVYPTHDVVIKFNNIYLKMKDIIIRNNSQNDKLASLRDTLLPKLMSGELEINSLNI